MVDLDVEVAEALKVVAQAAVAFVEQIVVYRAFLKDGDDVTQAIRIDFCALNHYADSGALIGGEAKVLAMLIGQVGFGFEFDVGLEAVLLLVVTQDAVESAVGRVVVDCCAGTKVGVVAELIERHAGIARDIDCANAGLGPGDDMECNVDELFFRVGCLDIVDGGLAESIVGEGAAHFGEGAGELVAGETRAGIKLAGALELRIDGCALCAIDGDSADKGARSAAKGDGDAIVEGRCVGLDGIVKAGGEQFTEAGAKVIFAHWRTFGLGQMAGKREEPIGGNSFKADATDGNALPAREG